MSKLFDWSVASCSVAAAILDVKLSPCDSAVLGQLLASGRPPRGCRDGPSRPSTRRAPGWPEQPPRSLLGFRRGGIHLAVCAAATDQQFVGLLPSFCAASVKVGSSGSCCWPRRSPWPRRQRSRPASPALPEPPGRRSSSSRARRAWSAFVHLVRMLLQVGFKILGEFLSLGHGLATGGDGLSNGSACPERLRAGRRLRVDRPAACAARTRPCSRPSCGGRRGPPAPSGGRLRGARRLARAASTGLAAAASSSPTFASRRGLVGAGLLQRGHFGDQGVGAIHKLLSSRRQILLGRQLLGCFLELYRQPPRASSPHLLAC